MAEKEVENALKNLNLNKKVDINILLLGGTGVGKSTMINSIANYLTYPDLKKAKKDKLMVLIPTQLNIKDKKGRYHIINTGEVDKNEFLEVGESATQDVKTYVFPIWNGQVKIRFIDTPGMGDTRGIDQDDVNSESILGYIGNLHELHAICFLLKPNESRNTVFFKYCMNQIFSRLDKTAAANIIFCFTNTRGTDYSAGETVGILNKTIEEIGSRPPYAKIPLNRNIFCFDNEPFRYLAAVQKGVELDSDVKELNKESWKKSATECWKLISYILGDRDNPPLKAHFVKSTNAINEARRLINQLAQPLADITQLIYQNKNVLQRHRDILKLDNDSLEDMKKNLYMPVISLETTQLTQPVTVCSARKCSEIYTVGGNNIWHYKKRCHDPCYLKNVTKEMIGDPALSHCAAMQSNTCIKCHCDFKVHMHVYYLTKTVKKNEIDENMQRKIVTRQDAMEEKRRIMIEIEKKKNELDEEHQVVVETCAKFAHFLQNNAITPFNDAYKEYIEYLINKEKCLGPLCNADSIKHLEQLVLQYTELKQRFNEALKNTRQLGLDDLITSKEINGSIQKLYNLKHNGKKIKELYECQKKSRNKEFQKTEYVHSIPLKSVEETNVKEKSEKRSKEKSEKKNKEDKSNENSKKEPTNNKQSKNKNRQHNQRDTRRGDQNRYRTRTPPPTYQEVHRNDRFQNEPQRPYYPPAGSGSYVPPPPQGSFGYQGGPSQYGSEGLSSYGSGNPYGAGSYRNDVGYNRGNPNIDVKIQFPVQNHSPYNGGPNQSPYIPPLLNNSNFHRFDNFAPHQQDGSFDPHRYREERQQPYDYRHGVNRQHFQDNYRQPRGNEQGKVNARGRGGIQKRNRNADKKGGGKALEKFSNGKQNNSKKDKKKLSDSDSSSSSSD